MAVHLTEKTWIKFGVAPILQYNWPIQLVLLLLSSAHTPIPFSCFVSSQTKNKQKTRKNRIKNVISSCNIHASSLNYWIITKTTKRQSHFLWWILGGFCFKLISTKEKHSTKIIINNNSIRCTWIKIPHSIFHPGSVAHLAATLWSFTPCFGIILSSFFFTCIFRRCLRKLKLFVAKK